MVVATGFFDGVHLGHRVVLGRLVEAARERGDESMVMTFWPHPRNVLQMEARNLRLLSTLQEKIELLKSCGVDHVEVLNFSREFSRMTTEEYLRTCVMEKFGGTALVLGYDNRMGSDSSDSVHVAETALGLGLEVIRTDKYSNESGQAVSSTKIRKRIEEGNISGAASMLGYDYSLLGVVVAGNRFGRTIGFPTANLQLYEPLKLVPGNGVYFVRAETLGREYAGMCNIGTKPTVSSGGAISIETNIFDFNEDIYGLDLRITFLQKIREERRHDSVELLKRQLERDREYCLSLMN